MAVTRADVAREAGVSPGVVSYVLYPGMRPVAPATRDRVLAAIEKLGYRPNAVAQALRTSSTRSLGLLVLEYHNPVFMDTLQAVEDATLESGSILIAGSTGGDEARQRQYLRTFIDRKVDGLLLASTHIWDLMRLAPPQDIPQVPIVVMDELPADAAASSVFCDDRVGACLGVDHLVASGARSVGLITGPETSPAAIRRREGWRDALVAAGRSTAADLVEWAPYSGEGGRSALSRLLARHGRLDAVMVGSDIQALGVLAEAYSRGIAIPSQMSVVAFDGTTLSAISSPPLTVVRQPLAEMARRSIRLVQSGSGSTDPGTGSRAVHEVLRPELVVRHSTRPVR